MQRKLQTKISKPKYQTELHAKSTEVGPWTFIHPSIQNLFQTVESAKSTSTIAFITFEDLGINSKIIKINLKFSDTISAICTVHTNNHSSTVHMNNTHTWEYTRTWECRSWWTVWIIYSNDPHTEIVPAHKCLSLSLSIQIKSKEQRKRMSIMTNVMMDGDNDDEGCKRSRTLIL